VVVRVPTDRYLLQVRQIHCGKKEESQARQKGTGIPCTVLWSPIRHHSAREEQEWKTRKREREDNAL